jgi:hypothetical protein
VISGVATIASTADSAVAQTPVNSISISLRAPAAIESELDKRLFLDGTDIAEGTDALNVVGDPPADTNGGGGGEDAPVGQLPETGVPCSLLALVGAALVLAGLALLGIGGRRRPPSFGV